MELTLRLPPAADMELVAVRAAEIAGRSVGIGRDGLDAVGIAVAEAFLNAVEHGGGRDVEVRIRTESDAAGCGALVVEVEDHGAGFDPGRDCPQRASGRLRRRGWGIRLMGELVDDLSIESRPGRTVVRLCKRREV